MLKFICLGSGSCGNCYYLMTGEGGILIDAGIGIRSIKKVFREYGLSLSHLKAIFVTHEHADHIKAVGVVSNEFRIPVFATESVHMGMMRNYNMTVKVKTENVRVLTKNETVRMAGFQITPFEVPHDSADNVGYRLEADDKTFCLITDAGCVTEAIKENVSRADYLVIEANYDANMLAMGPYPVYLKRRISGGTGHMCNDDTAKLLAENGFERLKHVWLCHLSEENNHPELVRKTIESRIQSMGYIVGKDVLIDVLKRKVPSLLYEL